MIITFACFITLFVILCIMLILICTSTCMSGYKYYLNNILPYPYETSQKIQEYNDKILSTIDTMYNNDNLFIQALTNKYINNDELAVINFFNKHILTSSDKELYIRYEELVRYSNNKKNDIKNIKLLLDLQRSSKIYIPKTIKHSGTTAQACVVSLTQPPKPKTVISDTDKNNYIEYLKRDRRISDNYFVDAGNKDHWCSQNGSIGSGWIAEEGSMERCKEKIDGNGNKMGRGEGKEDCAPESKYKVYCKRNDSKIQIDLNEWLKNKIIETKPPTKPPTQPVTTLVSTLVTAPVIVGADIDSIYTPKTTGSNKTIYSNNIIYSYVSTFYVEYYNKSNEKIKYNIGTLKNQKYDNPDIHITFLTQYTGPITLYRSDYNESVIKDVKNLQNAKDIVLKGGMAPAPTI